MTVGLNAYLLVAGLLFAVGFFGVLVRRNTLIVYMCLELMLNGVNVALVAFSRFNASVEHPMVDGSLFVFFIITVAAAEVALGLAIITTLYRRRKSVLLDDLNALKH